MGTCDALLCVSHTPKSVLEIGKEARIVQINFSRAFDRINYLIILYKLCSVGIGSTLGQLGIKELSHKIQTTCEKRASKTPLTEGV